LQNYIFTAIFAGHVCRKRLQTSNGPVNGEEVTVVDNGYVELNWVDKWIKKRKWK